MKAVGIYHGHRITQCRPMFNRRYNLVHLALRPHETFLWFIIKLNGIFPVDDGPLEGNR